MADININEIKEKVMTTLGTVADATKDIASKTADKAKAVARIAKLSMEINGERDTVKKAYLEIGKLYYELHRDDPDGFFAQLCDEVSIANASIAAKEAEIAELKANGAVTDDDMDIEVEFTECDDECEDEGESCDCGCEAPEASSCCCETDAADEEEK